MKKAFKRIGIALLIISLIAGALVYLFRAKIIDHYLPDVEQIGNISVKIVNDTCYIQSKICVTNNTPIKIEIDTIKYKVSLFNKIYLQNEEFLGILLRGNGGDTIDISLKIPYLTLIKDLKAERKKDDSATYNINVSLQYSTFFGKNEIPITKTSKIKIPQPPEIEVIDIVYKKIRRKKILANAKIKITNYSNLNLSIKELSYVMKVHEKGTIKGNYKNPIIINPHESTYLIIPVEITVNNFGKTVFQILMNKDNYNYMLSLNATLESTDLAKSLIRVEVKKFGQMELKK